MDRLGLHIAARRRHGRAARDQRSHVSPGERVRLGHGFDLATRPLLSLHDRTAPSRSTTWNGCLPISMPIVASSI